MLSHFLVVRVLLCNVNPRTCFHILKPPLTIPDLGKNRIRSFKPSFFKRKVYTMNTQRVIDDLTPVIPFDL